MKHAWHRGAGGRARRRTATARRQSTRNGSARTLSILARTLDSGACLVYLDSAATTDKQLQVLHAKRDFYLNLNAAVHRGSHQFSSRRPTCTRALGTRDAPTPTILSKRAAPDVDRLRAALDRRAA
ncbi:aminotransferase class V-fold PLP-dependent enzyme [Streptomyces sp. NPDC001828]|uniref:aminotransferase class V-fold PLP-dependent enzyme n=1 Tax=Streptomyces sp. NPDC001828 TaxID=3364615 RepID=UPI0036932BCF